MKKIKILLLFVILFKTNYAQDIFTARSQGVGANVTISGIVTNGDELGPIRYIEDSSAGLALYDMTTNNYISSCLRGDSITVSGTLVDLQRSIRIESKCSSFCAFFRKYHAISSNCYTGTNRRGYRIRTSAS